jgi:poly-gamma-glutamate capsule biosynthesis protein CapA/YwtB (metallophosphatase superfamily)
MKINLVFFALKMPLVFILTLFLNVTYAQDTLSLLFSGDIMGHGVQIKSAQTGKNQYDYNPCFKYIKPLIEKSDLAFCNLEVTLPGKAPYTGYPQFRSPDELAEAIKNAGFDVVFTANNHSNDSYASGLIHTIDALQDLNLQHTGTFKNAAERKMNYPLMVYKKGFKLAFLNYTYDTNGIPNQAPTIVNLISDDLIEEDMAAARAKKPDFIIAVMHWGIEYKLKENEDQIRTAKLLIKNGADLIIGMHPHVVEPIRKETATTLEGKSKEVVVVYSLGNFISNQKQPNTDGGILFQCKLIKRNGNKKAELSTYGYTPVWTYIHKGVAGKVTYYTLPIAKMEANPKLFEDMAAAARAKMKIYAAGVRKRLTCEEVK